MICLTNLHNQINDLLLYLCYLNTGLYPYNNLLYAKRIFLKGDIYFKLAFEVKDT